MSAGCLVVGSATPPVEEAIEDGVNGLLVDFFSPEQIVEAVDRVLDHPNRLQEMRERARQTIVERYDLKSICLPRQVELVKTLAAGFTPSLAELDQPLGNEPRWVLDAPGNASVFSQP
jgi:glycosyltransferase involved in cell wall biosynthesis